jgi:hypothetical protein
LGDRVAVCAAGELDRSATEGRERSTLPMAEYYRVQIQSIHDQVMTCRVTDLENWGRGWAHALIPSRTLALQFLCESARERGLGLGFDESSPLGRELAGTYPDQEGGYYPDHEEYEAWHEANLDRFISCVGVVDRYRCDQSKPPWDEGGDGIRDDPQATYLIAVTDPRWLVHLTPGIEWESKANDFDSGTFFEAAWRTENVMLLAEGIQKNAAFDRLPILADALQDAGCDAAAILNHCRGPGPHVRGCWVVDLVLGKE